VCLDLPANRIENSGNFELEQGRIGSIASLVRSHRMRTAYNDVFCGTGTQAVWTIASWIGGTKEHHNRRAESGSKMQGSGVTANDAGRVAQKTHQVAE